MKIPDSFKSNIKATFYDKTLAAYEVTETTDDEGWSRMTASEGEDFDGNVRFDNLAKLQVDYGLEDAIDISVTTDQNITAGTVIGYDGKTYLIVKAFPFDSHYLLVGKLWSSKSSTSTSA